MQKLALTLALAATATLFSGPTLAVQAEAATASSAKLTPCYLENISEQVLCGALEVPENYAEPDNGRTISINYAVLPAVSEGKRDDPLLVLAGGPGQAATELAAGMNVIFKDIRRNRDILLIDQRGTGQSAPLGCAEDSFESLALRDEEMDSALMALECLAQYVDRDLTQYHSVHAIQDFEAVREHLGYPQVNLYGGSYGSRAGLVYLREFPESVRSAVLDALAPVQVVVGPFGRHGADAFAKMLERCAADSACAQAFPHLEQSFQQALTQLQQNPELLTVNDPLSNDPVELRFTAGRFTDVLRAALYSPMSQSMLPFIITETAARNYQPLLGLMGSLMSQQPLYLGLTLSVLCSEDMPRATPELLAADADNDFIGGRTGESFAAMCSVWPQQQRPDSWFEPVVSDVPTLLLSGELDPVTPVAWGELAAETLSNSRHLVAPQGSHTIVSHTCANDLAAQFIDTLQLAELDDSCLQEAKPLPFILNENGAGR